MMADQGTREDAMSYRESSERLAVYRSQIAELRRKMREVQADAEPEEVRDYEFATSQGLVRLSALFGDKADLIVIHNMGASCPYCTLWADGYNGIYHHLSSRAAFIVSSPASGCAEGICNRPRLAIPDGQPRQLDVRCRHGIPFALGRLAARDHRVSAGRRPHPAGVRRKLRTGRRLLHALAPLRAPPGRGRRVGAKVPISIVVACTDRGSPRF